MDYQVFLVRPPAVARTPKGGLRYFRILEHGVSILPLATPNAAPTEYKFEHIAKALAVEEDPTELRLEIMDTTKPGFGVDTVRFCCEARTSLLTALLNRLDDMNGIGIDYGAMKDSNQKEELVDTVLRVRSASIVKMVNSGHRADSKITASKKVNFQDIVKLEHLSDDEEIVLVSLKSRTIRLLVKDPAGFLSATKTNMKTHLKWDIEIERVETSFMTDYYTQRYKKVRQVEFKLLRLWDIDYSKSSKGRTATREYPVLYEFQALKPSKVVNQELHRTLRITKHLLIESLDHNIINVHSLEDLLGVIVSETNENEVTLEFTSWKDCHFLLDDRDDFLASMADVMGMEKGSTFSMRLEPFRPCTLPERQNALHQGECETFYLSRFMAAYNNATREPLALHIPLKEYAANILVGESVCTDTKILQAVVDTLKETIGKSKPDFVRAATCCTVLVRLLGSKPCFEAVRTLPDISTILFQCAHSKNRIIGYHATLVIRSAIKLAAPPGPTDAVIASKQEFGNRSVVLNAEYLQQLVTLLHTHALSDDSSLQVIGILDVFTYALSSSPADIETGRAWLRAYESSIMATADLLCTFFRLTSDVTYTRLSILLQALLTLSSPAVVNHLQAVCLGRCVLLLHLCTAVFSIKPHLRLLGCSQVFFLMKGNHEARKLLTSVLPQGVMNLYANKLTDKDDKKELVDDFTAWKETIDLLHSGSVETPLLVWNDIKRNELRKFLEDEMEEYYAALETSDDIWYNAADVRLVYSTASEGGGSVVRGVHLELLVDHQPPAYSPYSSFWKLGNPTSLFQSVYQAMLLGFTPLFGNNNLPEIDLRLALHVLTWIYERHTDDVLSCMDALNVIETVVGMLREVIDSEHEVFVFKLIVFLLATLERGSRENVVRFIHAGGAAVLTSLLVLAAEKSCKNKTEFESDGWTSKGALSQGQYEILNYMGSDGSARMVRVPSVFARGISGKSATDGSLDAKDGIRWQDRKVPPKIQLGVVLDKLETLLRLSGDIVSNKQYFPPSATVLSLSKKETLCQLVQVLLRLKTPEFGRVLEIISTIAKENKSALAKLYSLGAFEILLWKFLAGDIVDSEKDLICKLLLQCHLEQDQATMLTSSDIDLRPCNGSALRLFLPDGLILRLMSEDMDSYKVFATVLDTEEDAPDIVWNMDMRKRLYEHLTSELEVYVRARANDCKALYVHTPRAPIYYPELADMVFSAPFYLQNLLDEERYHGYPINDPIGFMESLMLDLRKLAKAWDLVWCKEIKRIQLLLKALAYIVDRFPLELPLDAENLLITLASPALQTCLSETESSDYVCIEILQHAMKVLRRVVAVKTKGNDLPQESLNFALEIFSLGTRWSTDNTSLDLALAGSASLLEVISSHQNGRKHLWKDVRWQKGMQWALTSAVNDSTATPPRGLSPVSYHALNALKFFAGDSEYSERIVDEGFHLPLLLLIVPFADPKSESALSTLPISAADVLGSFVRGEQAKVSSLSKVIPRPLLSCLKNDDDLGRFINMVGADIQNPTSIWNAEVRAELRIRAQEQIAIGNEATNKANWLHTFEYTCLHKEFVIGGVFVKHLAFSNWEAGDLPDNAVFLELMMQHLEKERNVVSMTEVASNGNEDFEDKHVIFSEGMQEQGGKSDLEKYATVLVATREVLKFAASRGRVDLLQCYNLQTFLQTALMDQIAPIVWAELMLIFKELAHNEANLNAILQSSLLALGGIRLWEALTGDKGKEESEAILHTTLDMLLFLSENMPATVEGTNHFANSGIFFPLLCIFCDVDLPSLRTGIVETGKITHRQRLMAACIIGQLLLCSCGVGQRVSFLGDSAEPKDPFSESKKLRVMTTDVDDLMMLLEPGNHGEKPLIFQTLMFLMPLELLSTLAHNPARACNLYKETVYNPRLVWDDETRRRVSQTLTKEAIQLHAAVKGQVVPGLGSWSLELDQPVFTRWIFATLSENESKPLYRNAREESYVPEMYLGGFFLDQFLRSPEYFFGTILEQRFLREVKKAIVLDIYAEDPDSLRRVLLALLLLFKGRPYLLTGKSYIDIFLAVNGLLCSTGAGARMLAQPAIILTHSIANHKDIIDCMASEDLLHSLISFLDLNVPQEAAGFAGTDPRLCSLMLLRRLLRMSPSTVEITTNPVLKKLSGTALDVEGSKEVSKIARECLALMCHDKRRGKEIVHFLDSTVDADNVGFWDIPVERIWDDVAGFDVLQHFLQHRYPSEWWTGDGVSLSNGNHKDTIS